MISIQKLSRVIGFGVIVISTAVCSEGPKPPAAIIAVNAATQEAVVNTAVATPPRVKVTDEDGNGVPNVPVLFAVTGGEGLAGGATATTNADGEAAAGAWTLGVKVGPNKMTATVSGLTGSPVTFTAMGVAGPATAMTVATGNIQRAVTMTAVSVPPSVLVVDAHDNPVPAQEVIFAVVSGGGSVTGGTAQTNASGIATIGSWTLGDIGSNSIVAALSGDASISTTIIATAAPPPVPEKIEVVSGNRQARPAGAAVITPPAVRVTSFDGFPVKGATVTFAVGQGGGSITGATATTDAQGIATVGGWTLGSTTDFNSLTASVIGSVAVPATIGASACGGGGSGYKLTLCFTSAMTESQKAAFLAAAARWESLITGDALDVSVAAPINVGDCGEGGFSLATGSTVDDLLIFASVVPLDGPRGVLGISGPCFLRRAGAAFAVGDLSVIGQMRFDEADMQELEEQGGLNSVILHEMGHVLGIGSVWGAFGLLVDPSTPDRPQDTHFVGTKAIAAFNAAGGSTYGGSKVPVENSFGSGTINGHWRESVLKAELMTGFLSINEANPLSALTVQSLADIGYVVNADAADAYSLAPPPGAAASLSGDHPITITLVNDLYTGPLHTIDKQGRITRIR